ncbi:hypothetical protein IFM89_013356 [Coptis chinensis]|uniref:Dynein light chain n=1 Tax=Coptis chinensis TaxID=261450 RepID=A0A835I3S5_9MAGN|nr:hypothetical protein IFM89_013356 [Coptis chinensis]
MALRRSLTTSDAKKKSSSSMDPTFKNHTSLTNNTTKTPVPVPDPIHSFTLNKMKTHFFPKKTSANKPRTHSHTLSSSFMTSDPPGIPTYLQTCKSLTLSTNSDASFLKQSLHQQQKHSRPQQPPKKQITMVMEKQKPEKERDNIKVKNVSKEGRVVVVQEQEEPKRMSISLEEPKRPSISLVSIGGRRKSFCDSKMELKEFFSSVFARIVAVDMPPFMQIHAVNCARKTHDSLEKPSSKILACTLKKEFDGVYGPAWHCIVGTSFGSFVTHSVGGFLYFSIDNKLYFLLFKTTVQKAD